MTILKQPFGHTGHLSTRLIFGSWALNNATQKEADQVLEILLEYGVNHIDTARMYGNAEKCIGVWMKKHRADFFLATKSKSRSYQRAWKDLQQSLTLLNTDYVDLWQMHSLTNPVSWEKVMGAEGALKAFIEARDKGLVRFLGVTGHGSKAPAVHLRSLERFDFDTVLLPYSYCQMQQPRYTANFNALLTICRERNVAVQTIKSIARRPWGELPKTYNTYFYQPLETQQAIEKATHWALGLEGSFVISAGDVRLLPPMLAAASCYEQPPDEAEMKAMLAQFDIHPPLPY